MALDGLVISNIVHEINTNILDGRINKINQPQKDEIVLTIKSNRQLFKYDYRPENGRRHHAPSVRNRRSDAAAAEQRHSRRAH